MSFDALAEVVAPEILVRAVTTSQRLTELGVPHALIGGLAVGVHGHPRATKDVDFLVGPQAYEGDGPILVFREELKEIVRVGITDLLAVDPRFPTLTDELQLPEPGALPVVALEPLILLKLEANRPQDQADISSLLTTDASVDRVVRYLRDAAPQLEPRLLEILNPT